MHLLNHNLFVATSKISRLVRNRTSRYKLATPTDFSSAVLSNSISAWSVHGENLNASDIASTLFSLSLVPYLVFLFFLSRKETKTPQIGNFGFQFLLAFVFATIPAGIIAKQYYHEILANVDVLHGIAESLLTITNLLIIRGFLPSSTVGIPNFSTNENLFCLATAAATYFATIVIPHHIEPSNALSLPTWAVHTSSVMEWLIAMKLIWWHADNSGNPRWKGLTLAMLPAHASGLCACVFHLFYNAPAVQVLVALQAALTVLGNTTMAAAAFRIYKYEQENLNSVSSTVVASYGVIKSNNDWQVRFWGALFVKAVSLAVIVKYGELLVNLPFHPSILPAVSLVLAPTVFNVVKWKNRSGEIVQQQNF